MLRAQTAERESEQNIVSAPPLTAKLAPWMRRLEQHSEICIGWLEQYGGVVHAVVRAEFERNVCDLLQPFKEREVKGSLYFARKANKLSWFVAAAKKLEIGVDVASLNELKETLSVGIEGNRIIVTAVGKNATLIDQSLDSGCRIIVDNQDELEYIAARSVGAGREINIGLRFAGFIVNDRKLFSRFGFQIADAKNLLSYLNRFPLVKVDYLHAHLDKYDSRDRSGAGWQLLDLVDDFEKANHKITGIDLGGGIAIRYLDSEMQWEEFQEALLESVQGNRKPFTFGADGLGYVSVKDQVVGKPDLYPAFNTFSKERFIAQVLDDERNGEPFHKAIASRGLTLYFEPGRALLDNVGVTVAGVSFRKRDTDSNLLVGVSMNRMNLKPFRSEFICDPILLPRDPARPQLLKSVAEGAFLVGNLCSESDLIYRRKLKLAFMPEVGDAVLFPNTAGYMAHHMEIGTHGGDLPRNLLLDDDSLSVIDVF
jgi:diaminopimelate decarboxylase